MIAVRRATADDAQTIAHMESLCFSDAWSVQAVRDAILSPLAMNFIATDAGRAVGYLLGSHIPPEGEILRIAVLPNARRAGVGRSLICEAIRAVKTDGAGRLFLEVRSQNAIAYALYRSCGFFDTGCRKNYYKSPTDDARLMQLPIPPIADT